MRTLIRILLIATALFLIVAGVIFYMIFNSDPAQQDVLEDQSFEEKIDDIEILLENSRVEFLPSPGASTRIVLMGNSDDFSLKTEVSGSRLAIEVEDRNRFFLFGLNRSHTLQVYVPKNGVSMLAVESDNGRIDVRDIAAEKLDLSANNGAITVTNMDADMDVRTSNGRIIFRDVTGELVAKANNGRIELITGTLDFPIDFETDNGRIEIRTDSEPDNTRIEADVDNGSIDIFGQSSRRVSFGDGDVLIRLVSNNGSIDVE